jgi:hypothetical protein
MKSRLALPILLTISLTSGCTTLTELIYRTEVFHYSWTAPARFTEEQIYDAAVRAGASMRLTVDESNRATRTAFFSEPRSDNTARKFLKASVERTDGVLKLSSASQMRGYNPLGFISNKNFHQDFYDRVFKQLGVTAPEERIFMTLPGTDSYRLE